ncbi:hypothetical protein [Microbacterium sp. F2]|uniref:hypothetical protein n=1 Tax=Microbacterium sp. F2 TaxID=3422228 RepID=UPI003FD28A73
MTTMSVEGAPSTDVTRQIREAIPARSPTSRHTPTRGVARRRRRAVWLSAAATTSRPSAGCG